MKRILLFVTAFFFNSQNGFSQSVTLEEHAVGFNWLIGFEHAPGDDRIYAFQKDGFIKIVNTDGSVDGTPFLDISDQENNMFNNEHGLVGLAFHPDYQSNGYCFVFYNEVGTGDVKVVRYERSAGDPDQLDKSTETLLLTWPHPIPNHVGGCLKFGHDGYLYIASGDGSTGGDPEGNAQNLQSYLGKILRIDVDNGTPYSIPPDNPFASNSDALPEIYAYGLRNPWRFSFDEMTGDLWITDVGQDEREEIDFQAFGTAGGQNYGWNCKEGTLTYDDTACDDNAIYTNPLFEYQHELAAGDCSISGGVVYRGTEFADLYGKYIYTDFCSGRIWALSKDGDVVESNIEMGDFVQNDFTILDQNEKGELFVAGFFSNKIYKVVSENCMPVSVILGPSQIDLPTGGTVELTLHANTDYDIQWYRNSSPITGATSLELTVNEEGNYLAIVTNPNNGCSSASNDVFIGEAGSNEFSITGLEEVCEGATVVYTINNQPPNGSIFDFAIGGGMLIGGGAFDELIIEWGPPGIGLIILNVTHPDGTLETAEITVNIFANDIIPVGIVFNASCDESDGAIEMATQGTGPFSYNWSNGASSSTITNLAAGEYTVTVSNELGCTAVNTFIVNEPTHPIITIPSFPLTCDSFFTLPEIDTAALMICDFDWGVPNPDTVYSGFYTYTITFCDGCTQSSDYSIFIAPPVELSFDTISPTLGQSNGSITALPQGGSAPFNYMWDNGETSSTISDLPAGSYSVTVTDINGCTAMATVMIGTILNTDFLDKNLRLTISPNPFSDQLDLSFDLVQTNHLSFSIINANGKIVQELLTDQSLSSGSHEYSFKMDSWAAGIYFLKVEMSSEIGMYQLVRLD